MRQWLAIPRPFGFTAFADARMFTCTRVEQARHCYISIIPLPAPCISTARPTYLYVPPSAPSPHSARTRPLPPQPSRAHPSAHSETSPDRPVDPSWSLACLWPCLFLSFAPRQRSIRHHCHPTPYPYPHPRHLSMCRSGPRRMGCWIRRYRDGRVGG